MSLTRRITECDLDKLRSEHDAYEDMAKHCAKSRVPSHLRLAEVPEMACATGEEPQDDCISPFLIVGAIALAFVAFFVGLGYFVGPEIEGLLRQMN